jgi:hypothetical protein
MALLWCDGFDHYGVLGNLTEGVYAEVTAGVTLSTSNPRTGTHHLTFTGISMVRRIFGAAKTAVGIGAVFYYPALPTTANRARLFEFRDAANVAQVSVGVDTTGTVSAYRGTVGGTLLGTSASPVITAETYTHVEVFVTISDTVGTVEVRVNGVTALSLAGQDTKATANTEVSQVAISGAIGSGGGSPEVDDLFCYDDSGSYNNSFLGDRRVLTLFPNADTAQADWSINGDTNGYQCIDEASPDGDTTYIASSTAGEISEFGLDDLPGGISAVSGVVLVEMARKTEAGVANTQLSVISGASTTAGADKPMTEIYTYRQDVFEIDPASAAPFTPSEVNALKVKIERTA